jgi:hypothetical protein
MGKYFIPEENTNRLVGELCLVGRIILKYFGSDLDSCGSG